MRVVIYTDGACRPNPGPGGWAAVILPENGQPVRLYGGDPETTNNRMELTAAIKALEWLPEPSDVILYSDSGYLVKGMTEWIDGWLERRWKKVKNKDLWLKLLDLSRVHKIQWKWTEAHAGDRWNEEAHTLANSAIPDSGDGRFRNTG